MRKGLHGAQKGVHGERNRVHVERNWVHGERNRVHGERNGVHGERNGVHGACIKGTVKETHFLYQKCVEFITIGRKVNETVLVLKSSINFLVTNMLMIKSNNETNSHTLRTQILII